MTTLISYGKEISSVFQLLGEKENDLTLSMSWALSRCPSFLQRVVHYITGIHVDAEKTVVLNQNYTSDLGITDIELTDYENFHVIIEAKRGWILPGEAQLTKYSLRKDLVSSKVPIKRIITLSECSHAYATANLPFQEKNGIPINHLSWAEVYELANESRADANNEQKHTLIELLEYLKGVMTMQKIDSNLVYVVSLSSGKPDGCALTWIEIVQKYKKYFCPMGGKGWPKDPPNYIAFRYYGKLQAIHHIEGYAVSRNMHDEFPEMPNEEWDMNHYIYRLGSAIIPSKEVKTGKLFRNGRVWAMLDTLLTCDTVSEARDVTKERIG